MSRPAARPRYGGAVEMDLMEGDDRLAEGAAIIRMADDGRRVVAEVFAGMALDEAKVSALLDARASIFEQWGKAQHAGLMIGKVLLRLSRTLSEEEFRRVRRGADRLFPFGDSLATKFRRAALLVEEWRIPLERMPPYTTLYEIATLPPEGREIVRARGLLRADLQRADIVALRRQLKPGGLDLPTALADLQDAAEASPDAASRDELERQRDKLLTERRWLKARLKEVEDAIESLTRRLALSAGDRARGEQAASG